MIETNVQTLLDLCDLDALASREERVRNYIKSQLDALNIIYQFDTLGSLIAHIPATATNAPKLMFSAHMDEVGFLVRAIDQSGVLHVITLGGVKPAATKLCAVRIVANQGVFHGVMVNNSDATNDALIDCGFDSYEAAVQAGIHIGDMVVFDVESHYLPQEHRVLAKALDDRVGVFSLLQLANKLVHENTRPNDVYLTFSSSEEVGTRGGKTAAAKIEPDIFIALDVASKDAPGPNTDISNKRQLRKGPMLVMYDKTLAPSPRLLNTIEDLLTQNSIPYQEDMFAGGGTDAAQASLVGSGIFSVVLGIPLRFCHGPRSIVDLQDVEHAIEATYVVSTHPLSKILDTLRTF